MRIPDRFIPFDNVISFWYALNFISDQQNVPVNLYRQFAVFAIANLVLSLIFVINLEMQRRLIGRAFLIQCDDHTFEDVIVENHILQLVELFPKLHTKHQNDSSKWLIKMSDSPEVDQRLRQLQEEFLVVVAHFPFEHLHLYNACNNILVDMASASSSFLLLYSPF